MRRFSDGAWWAMTDSNRSQQFRASNPGLLGQRSMIRLKLPVSQ
jgi:hypothetical protein